MVPTPLPRRKLPAAMMQPDRSQIPPAPALVALGANLPSRFGEPAESLRVAILLLATNKQISIARVSRFYRTPAFPAGSGPDYINAAALLHSSLSAEALLEVLHSVEARMGRTRQTRWGARVIDIDLIAMGQEVLPDMQTQTRWRDLPSQAQRSATPDRLILPHPRLQDRAFVLVPLAEVAPMWRHPLLGQDAASLLAALPAADRDEVVPMTGLRLDKPAKGTQTTPSPSA